jgi:hypothetical protein
MITVSVCRASPSCSLRIAVSAIQPIFCEGCWGREGSVPRLKTVRRVKTNHVPVPAESYNIPMITA